MKWLRSSLIAIGSLLVFAFSIFWIIADGGHEPRIVAVGSAITILINYEYFLVFLKKKRKLSPEQKIAARDRWRPVFQDYFLEAASKGYRVGDAIIHDVIRIDTYPNTSDKKGISSWFRVGLMGTYNHGILLGLRWTNLEEKNGKWLENWKNPSDDSIKVILLGQVPYEAIESVNFDGDHYYNKPHIYCHFDYKGQPYERLYYGEEFRLAPNMPTHYSEIAEVKSQPRWKFWKSSS